MIDMEEPLEPQNSYRLIVRGISDGKLIQDFEAGTLTGLLGKIYQVDNDHPTFKIMLADMVEARYASEANPPGLFSWTRDVIPVEVADESSPMTIWAATDQTNVYVTLSDPFKEAV